MRLRLVRPNWYQGEPTTEVSELVESLDGVWRESANLFALETKLSANQGRSGPLGMQPFINEVINQRLEEKGWAGVDGRFSKNRTWIRVTFRHQMSLGSDFLDAIRLARAENYEQCIIVAADDEFLKIITPRDWRSICSFSKLSAQLAQLEGHFDTPLLIGELTPISSLSPDSQQLVYGRRLRL